MCSASKNVLLHALIKTWSDLKTLSTLKEEFRKNVNDPANLLTMWTEESTVKWQNNDTDIDANYGQIHVDMLSKITFNYIWKCIPVSQSNFEHVITTFLTLPYQTKNDIFNQRGIIIHYFNDFIGIIQTNRGKVLFDRNQVFMFRNGWNKVKQFKQAGLGTVVKLNAGLATYKTKKHKNQYYYARKVWIPYQDQETDEPYPSIEIQGGTKYWTNAFTVFEAIARQNADSINIIATKDTKGKQKEPFSKEYNECFNYYLLKHMEKVQPKHSSMLMEQMKSLLDTFEPFIQYVKKNYASEEVLLVSNTLPLIVARGISLNDLINDYKAKQLYKGSSLFEEKLEFILRGVDYLNQGVQLMIKGQKKLVCNLAPFFIKYFSNQLGLSGKIDENMMSVLNKHPKSSMSYIESLFNFISQLQGDLDRALKDGPREFINSDPTNQKVAQILNSKKNKIEKKINSPILKEKHEKIDKIDKNDKNTIEKPIETGTKKKKIVNTSSNNTITTTSTQNADNNTQITNNLPKMESHLNSNSDMDTNSNSNRDLNLNTLSNLLSKVESNEKNIACLTSSLNQFHQSISSQMKEQIALQEQFKLVITNQLAKLSEQAASIQQRVSVLEKEKSSNKPILLNNIDNFNKNPPFLGQMKKKQVVKLTSEQFPKEIVEFTTNENGNLSMESVRGIFEGATALKYRSETGALRVISPNSNNILEPDLNSWTDRIYVVNIPQREKWANNFQQQQQQQAIQPQHSMDQQLFRNPPELQGMSNGSLGNKEGPRTLGSNSFDCLYSNYFN